MRPDKPMNLTVQTRHDGIREFKNVTEADPTGMPYDPADYDLMVVKEPGVGYRCVALEGIQKLNMAPRQPSTFNLQARRDQLLARRKY